MIQKKKKDDPIDPMRTAWRADLVPCHRFLWAGGRWRCPGREFRSSPTPCRPARSGGGRSPSTGGTAVSSGKRPSGSAWRCSTSDHAAQRAGAVDAGPAAAGLCQPVHADAACVAVALAAVPLGVSGFAEREVRHPEERGLDSGMPAAAASGAVENDGGGGVVRSGGRAPDSGEGEQFHHRLPEHLAGSPFEAPWRRPAAERDDAAAVAAEASERRGPG